MNKEKQPEDWKQRQGRLKVEVRASEIQKQSKSSLRRFNTYKQSQISLLEPNNLKIHTAKVVTFNRYASLALEATPVTTIKSKSKSKFNRH